MDCFYSTQKSIAQQQGKKLGFTQTFYNQLKRVYSYIILENLCKGKTLKRIKIGVKILFLM